MYPYVAFALSVLTPIFWGCGVKEITGERRLNRRDPFLEPGRSLPPGISSCQKTSGSIGTRSQARPDNLPRWRCQPQSAQLEVTGTGEPDSGRKRPAAGRWNKQRLKKMRGVLSLRSPVSSCLVRFMRSPFISSWFSSPYFSLREGERIAYRSQSYDPMMALPDRPLTRLLSTTVFRFGYGLRGYYL
jgi:hypothetical protein